MDDAFGNSLSVGDYVLYADTGDGSSLFIGRIEKINPKTVRVRITEGRWRVGRTVNVGSNRVALAESVQSPEDVRRGQEAFIRDTLSPTMSDYICGTNEGYKFKTVASAIKSLKAKGLNKEAIELWFESPNPFFDNQTPVVKIVEWDSYQNTLNTKIFKATEAVVV